jgi:hypothetical protein
MNANLKALLIDQYRRHEVQHHCAPAARDETPVPTALRAHRLVDIYKCLHQGEFGVGHMIDDPQRFKERLLGDYLAGSPESDVPVIESVSADGTSLRLNLRPFRALWGHGAPEACAHLTDVCLRSAAGRRGNAERFFDCLNAFNVLNRDGVLAVGPFAFRFPPPEVERFLAEVRRMARRTGQIPVFSHSPDYNHFNRPSYRVVEAAVISQSPLAFLIEDRHELFLPNGQ